jgi:hypothetical protein
MSDDTFNRRLTAAAGLLLAVFLMIGFLLPGAPPKADDGVSEIVDFFTDKRGSLLAGDFFIGIGALFFFVFAGGLRRHLRATARGDDGLAGTSFGGGVAGVALLLAGTAVINGIAFRAAGGGANIRSEFDTANALFFLSGFPFAVFFGAAAWAGARSGALPGWTSWLGWLAAVLQIVGAIGLFAKSGFFATGGAMGFVAPVVGTIWALGVSWHLYRGAGAGATAPSGGS